MRTSRTKGRRRRSGFLLLACLPHENVLAPSLRDCSLQVAGASREIFVIVAPFSNEGHADTHEHWARRNHSHTNTHTSPRKALITCTREWRWHINFKLFSLSCSDTPSFTWSIDTPFIILHPVIFKSDHACQHALACHLLRKLNSKFQS